MRCQGLVAADLVCLMVCYGQRRFEGRNILLFDENWRLAGCQFTQVKFVQLAVMAMCLPAENWQHRRLRAIEHGDCLATAKFNDRCGNRVDAQRREDASK